MQPDRRALPAYVEALTRIIRRIVVSLGDPNPKTPPIKLYVAGGAALHLLTGARVTEDIDGVFSRRVLLDDDLEVSYRDADGRARVLYFDRNYNDTLGLLHEDAYRDSEPLVLPDLDGKVIEVRLLSPTDLAVSKLARYSDQDSEDIATLAREGLIEAKTLRKRAEEALGGYVGNLKSLQISIDLACKLVEVHGSSAKKPRKAGR